jgi:hypothetical protein
MNDLLAKVKQNNEDFEWYPTTNEIIEALYKDILSLDESTSSILDIGAGDGNVFKVLTQLSKDHKEKVADIPRENRNGNYQYYNYVETFNPTFYAIEKSKTLIQAMDKDVFVVGSDFNEQSLIDKKVDCIYCNPPYSEYEEWTNKILREANSKIVYLLIPKRWTENEIIQHTIAEREIKYAVIGEYSFEHSEYRQARAIVNLIRFDISSRYDRKDSFDIWFEDHFKINAKLDDSESKYAREQATKKKVSNELISVDNFVKESVKLYNRDLENLLNNYKALESLDSSLLSELGISVKGVKEGLKLKIENLKSIYWHILFERLDTITIRLTEKSRERLTKKLFENVNIDYSEDNIYMLIIWVIKNSNEYFNKQLLEVYEKLADKENIILYKSNKRIIEDDWRYVKSSMSHYALDYRLVISVYNTFGGYEFEKVNGISKEAYNFIKDIFTVAINLGFNLNINSLHHHQYESRKEYNFYDSNGDIFVALRLYQNGNIHFKFSQKFIKKLNIEAARLNGWIKSPKEASEEFDVTFEEAAQMFKNNLQLTASNVILIEEAV